MMIDEFVNGGIKAQIKFYFERKDKVHIDLNSGKFLNGFIISISEETFMFKDQKITNNIPLFYSAIKNLEPYVAGGKY